MRSGLPSPLSPGWRSVAGGMAAEVGAAVPSVSAPFRWTGDGRSCKTGRPHSDSASDDCLAVADAVPIGVPGEGIGQAAEELFAIGEPITIGVPGPGIGQVDVDLVPIRHAIPIEIGRAHV